MRLTAMLTLVLTLAAFGQERGVFVEDVDRNVDACTNFFDYANGAWRAKNPIPPSMTRWSRRWAAGELSKEQLRTILDETSARRDWPKGSVDQLIGDFYGSCMDEQRINALGVKPLQPLLSEIDRVRTRAALQDAIARRRAGNAASSPPTPSSAKRSGSVTSTATSRPRRRRACRRW